MRQIICMLCAACLVPTMAAAAPPPTTRPDYAALVNDLVQKLGEKTTDGPNEAEVRLSMLPPHAFRYIEMVSHAQLPAAEHERLVAIVARQRPWQAARMRRQKLIDEESEWNLRTALDAYEKAGKHDPKWDDNAREGIRLICAVPDNMERGVTMEDIVALRAARGPLEKAQKAGCNDPFVMYLLAISLQHTSSDDDRAWSLLQHAADEMYPTKYPAYRKIRAAARCYKVELAMATQDAMQRHLNHFDPPVNATLSAMRAVTSDLWPRCCKDGAPQEALYNLATDILEVNSNFGPLFEPVYKSMVPAAQKVLSPALALSLEGTFEVAFAWQARGGGFANTVTDEGQKLFAERLAKAQDALQKAYQLDPNSPHAPIKMITVEMGEGNGRAAMEKWFERAMAADPDSYQACVNKLNFLLPRWYGSDKEMLAFGRECYKTGNWRGRIPLMLMTAHINIMQDVDALAYVRQPAFWRDAQSVYVPYLRGAPDDLRARSSYCACACMTQHWTIANQQFNILGDGVIASEFGGEARIKMARERAKELAGK